DTVNYNPNLGFLIDKELAPMEGAFAEIFTIQRIDKTNQACANCKELKPVVAIHPREWQKYPGKTKHGLQLPALTVETLGRFGNQMGAYATLYALSRTYNISVRVMESMKKNLLTTFPRLSIQLIPS
ncbi:hypothetical protein SK128_023127, partial [Halocaridina rubra]